MIFIFYIYFILILIPYYIMSIMSKKEKVIELLKINLPKERIISTLKLIVEKVASLNSDFNYPEEIWEDYENIFEVEELYRRLTPIYEEYFTDEELDFIVKTIKNPLYNKWINLGDLNSEVFIKTSKTTEEYQNEIISALLLKNENNGYV